MQGLAIGRTVRRVWPALAPVLILVAICVPLSLASAPLARVAVTILINVIAVVGLYMFVGNSGSFSLGHVALMAVGGYAAGIMAMAVKTKSMLLPNMPGVLAHFSIPWYAAVVVGGLVAAAFALLVSQPMLRLKSLAIPIGTFALLAMVRQVLVAWESLTGGSQTLTGLPRETTVWLCLVWAVIVIAVALVFQTSRVGLRLKASREDEVAARAVGISVLRERTWAWVISAFVMGVAGGLLAFELGVIYPDAFWVSATMLFIVMLIGGGIGSLGGAVVGAVVISVLSEVLRRLEGGFSLGSLHVPGRSGVRELVFAAVLLVVLIKRPAGIMGGKEFRSPSRRVSKRRTQ